MRQRGILILAAVAILVVVAAVYALQQRESRTVQAQLPALMFPGLAGKLNDVASISVAGPEESFTIARDKDGKWTMPTKGGYPVPVETVKQALVGMSELKPAEQKTANPEFFSKLDLQDRDAKDSKSLEIRLKDNGGKDIAAVLVGKRGATSTASTPGTIYVRKPGENQTWLAQGRFEPDPKAVRWLDRDVVKVERQRINTVTASRADGAKLVVARETPTADDFKPTNAPAEAKLISGGPSNALGSALGYISYDDVAPAASIDFTDAAKTEYRTFDGLVVTVSIKEKDAKYWVKFEAAQDKSVTAPEVKDEKEKPKTAEEVAKEVESFNAKTNGWAYEVTKYKAEDFTKTLDDVIEKEKEEKKGS